MRRVLISGLMVGFFIFLFSVSPVFAQTANPASTVINNEINNILTDTQEVLIGINVPEPTNVPNGLGLWFRDWRERVSLALTFNSVKKAEKQFLFAEERLKIAEKIAAESTNPRAQEMAQKVIERANDFMKKIEEKQSEWSEKNDERASRLKENLVAHQMRREQALDRMEEKMTEEERIKFEEMRVKILADGDRLLRAIENKNLSEKIKTHLDDVKIRIEKHSKIVEEYLQKKKNLLQETKDGVDVKEEMTALWEERKGKMEEIRLEYKENREKLQEGSQEKLYDLKTAKEFLKMKQKNIREQLKKLREMSGEDMSREERLKKLEELKKEQAKNQAEYLKKAQEFRERIENASTTNFLPILRLINKAEVIKDQAEIRAGEMEQELEN